MVVAGGWEVVVGLMPPPLEEEQVPPVTHERSLALLRGNVSYFVGCRFGTGFA
jgi:hypothetical protein